MTRDEYLTGTDPVWLINYLADRPRGDTVRGGVAGPPLVSDRKLRLFACACCRAVWDGKRCPRCKGKGVWPDPDGRCSSCRGTGRVRGLTDPRSRKAVKVAEQFADGLADYEEMIDAANFAGPHPNRTLAYRCCWEDAAAGALEVCALLQRYGWLGPTPQAELLREIAGNPFDRVRLPSVARTRREHWSTTRGIAMSGTREVSDGTYCPWLVYKDGTVPKLARHIYDRRDYAALPLLADALEEAGAQADDCPDCDGHGFRMYCRTCRGTWRGNVAGCPGCGWEQGRQVACQRRPCLPCGSTGQSPYSLVGHLRGPGPHTRGCWALDLLAGKE